MTRFILILIFLSIACTGLAQETIDDMPVLIKSDQPLLEYLSSIEAHSEIRFYYLKEWLEPFTINKTLNGLPLRKMLSSVLQDSEISVVFPNKYSVIFFKDPQRELERDAIVESALTRKIKVDKIGLGSQKITESGTMVNLQGIVKDKESQTPIVGATVYVNDINVSAQTDSKGQYQLTMPVGEYILSFRFLNYEERLLVVTIYESGVADVELDEIPTRLEEVIITDQSIVEKRVGQTSGHNHFLGSKSY